MTITIKDIANVCDISYSTVSRVLNGKYIRKTKKTEKILETASALGYNPNNLAIQLVKKSSNMLGLLIPDVSNPHYSEITKCVGDAALASGYQIFLCNTDWDLHKEEMYRNSLIVQRVAGLIVMPVSDESHEIFCGLDIPVVLLGSRTLKPELNYVVMDNVLAAKMATEYLIRHGCCKLAFMCRKPKNFTASDRIDGFTQALMEHHLPMTRDSIINCESASMDGGYTAMKQLLRHYSEAPEGIVAFNDFMAIGAKQAIEEQGLVVGKDIALISFDNILFSALNIINLTTITPNNQEMAQKSLTIWTKGMGRKGCSFIVEPHMVIRGSCGEYGVGF